MYESFFEIQTVKFEFAYLSFRYYYHHPDRRFSFRFNTTMYDKTAVHSWPSLVFQQ